jgi:nucleoside-diphosphate-sugar epimerase
MPCKETKVLVTGGTGFIGTGVCSELAALGRYEVTSFSNESPSPIVAGVTYLKGDVTNFNEVKDAVDDNEVIINLAGLLGVFRSIENPDLYVDVNIQGTVNALKAATRPDNRVKRFIHASSDAIYGEYPLVEGGITESFSPLTPPNPYSVSKLAQEYFCHSYFYTHNLPLVALRFSNAYGPGQKEKNIVWTFIEDAALGKPIVLFGEGNHGRDFTYVTDIAQGVTKAINRGRLNEAYHISSESFIRIRDLARLIAGYFPGVDVEHVPANKAVVNQGFLSVAKAKRDLGYEPQVLIGDGVSKCVLWYKNENQIRE